MIAFKKILAPLDFSECSYEALNYAASLASKYGAELCLLHVLEVPLYASAGVTPSTLREVQKMSAEVEKDASKALDEAANRIKDVQVSKLLWRGDPHMEIIRAAKELSCDLIVMGTHGRTGLPHILLGSVAERVVRTAPCPVFSVKPKGFEFKL